MSRAMQVICPKCGAAVAGVEIDLVGHVGLCRPCGEMIPLPNLAPLEGARMPLATRYRPDTLKWTERSQGASFEAVVPPQHAMAIPLLFFAFIWDAFIVIFYYHMLTAPKTPLIGLLFPLLHAAAGVFITYLGVTLLLNSTRIAFDNGTFRAVSGPVPWRGNVALPVEDIDGFRATNRSTDNGRTFSVVADARGVARKLPISVRDGASAEYVAARLCEVLESAKRTRGGLTYRS